MSSEDFNPRTGENRSVFSPLTFSQQQLIMSSSSSSLSVASSSSLSNLSSSSSSSSSDYLIENQLVVVNDVIVLDGDIDNEVRSQFHICDVFPRVPVQKNTPYHTKICCSMTNCNFTISSFSHSVVKMKIHISGCRNIKSTSCKPCLFPNNSLKMRILAEIRQKTDADAAIEVTRKIKERGISENNTLRVLFGKATSPAADSAIMRFLVTCGVAPNVLQSREWKAMLKAIIAAGKDNFNLCYDNML